MLGFSVSCYIHALDVILYNLQLEVKDQSVIILALSNRSCDPAHIEDTRLKKTYTTVLEPKLKSYNM